MFWFYRRSVTGRLQTGEFLMNGGITRDEDVDIADGVRLAGAV